MHHTYFLVVKDMQPHGAKAICDNVDPSSWQEYIQEAIATQLRADGFLEDSLKVTRDGDRLSVTLPDSGACGGSTNSGIGIACPRSILPTSNPRIKT